MSFGANNNKNVIGNLARSSLKGNGRRNFFVVFTIALSVSLLTFLAMFGAGLQKLQERQVAKMQHVIYYNTSKEQIEEIEKDGRTEQAAKGKTGLSIEVEDFILSFSYLEESAGNLEMLEITEGKMPEREHEIAVQKEYLEKIGKPVELGVKLDFTFLDETTEEFEVTGFCPKPDKSKVYTIAMSEAYAESGAQLKEVPYMAIVRIRDAERMNQSAFLSEIRDMADTYGIERRYINENNAFVNTLSGDSRQLQKSLLLIGIGTAILFVSVLVIYSVFYLSVVGRIRQFGQLITIGMTKKQIRNMVQREGFLLSMRGIPIGLFIGILAGYLVQPDGWDFKNTVLIAVVISIVDVITVMISIWKPAKLASVISPIEAAKFSGYQDHKGSSKETKKLHRKMTPLNLAGISFGRNRKKSVMTMISLGVGGVLFMVAAAFVESVDLKEYARGSEMKNGEYAIGFSGNAIRTVEHGAAGIQVQNPLNKEFRDEIEGIDGVDHVFAYENAEIEWAAHGLAGMNDTMGGISERKLEKINPYLEKALDYDAFREKNGILIQNNSVYEETFGEPFSVGEKVEVIAFNGKEEVKEEYTVMGIISDRYQEENGYEAWIFAAKENVKRITGGMELTTNLVVKTEREKEEEVGEKLQEIVDEQPLITMESLKERMLKYENQFSLIFSVMLGLSGFLIVFSLINLVNTLITNIVTRKQEFAMLESIGMSEKQLNRMIQGEGIFLAVGNCLITLLLGTAAGAGMIQIGRYFGGTYMHFHFPIWYFIGYTAFIVVVPVAVSKILLHSFRKDSLVERIRVSD